MRSMVPDLIRLLAAKGMDRANGGQGDPIDQGDSGMKMSPASARAYIRELLENPQPEGLGEITLPMQEAALHKAAEATALGFYPDITFKSGEGWTVRAQWY